MYEHLRNFFSTAILTNEFWIVFGVIAPIFLLYIGVLIYLFIIMCRKSSQKENLQQITTESDPEEEQDGSHFRVDSEKDVLMLSVKADESLGEFLRSNGRNHSVYTRQSVKSAQGALGEAVRMHDLGAVKSSLRKTSKSTIRKSTESYTESSSNSESELIQLDTLPRDNRKRNNSFTPTLSDKPIPDEMELRQSLEATLPSAAKLAQPSTAANDISINLTSPASTKTTYFGPSILSLDDSLCSDAENSPPESISPPAVSVPSTLGPNEKLGNKPPSNGNIGAPSIISPIPPPWTEVYLGEV